MVKILHANFSINCLCRRAMMVDIFTDRLSDKFEGHLCAVISDAMYRRHLMTSFRENDETLIDAMCSQGLLCLMGGIALSRPISPR